MVIPAWAVDKQRVAGYKVQIVEINVVLDTANLPASRVSPFSGYIVRGVEIGYGINKPPAGIDAFELVVAPASRSTGVVTYCTVFNNDSCGSWKLNIYPPSSSRRGVGNYQAV